MGDLLSALGQGEAARQFYQKSLDIRQRLVDQEPDRADYQIDLVISLFRTEEWSALERALVILKQLEAEGRLMPQYEPLIAELEKLL
jgi:hypothetical protein